MIRIRVHLAVPETRREIAAALYGLSGDVTEFSIPLQSTADGPSRQWDDAHEYSGLWWGASQSFESNLAQAMLYDGLSKQCEAWFAAFDEVSGTLLEGGSNCPMPADSSWFAFVTAIGCEVIFEEGEL